MRRLRRARRGRGRGGSHEILGPGHGRSDRCARHARHHAGGLRHLTARQRRAGAGKNLTGARRGRYADPLGDGRVALQRGSRGGPRRRGPGRFRLSRSHSARRSGHRRGSRRHGSARHGRRGGRGWRRDGRRPRRQFGGHLGRRNGRNWRSRRRRRRRRRHFHRSPGRGRFRWGWGRFGWFGRPGWRGVRRRRGGVRRQRGVRRRRGVHHRRGVRRSHMPLGGRVSQDGPGRNRDRRRVGRTRAAPDEGRPHRRARNHRRRRRGGGSGHRGGRRGFMSNLFHRQRSGSGCVNSGSGGSRACRGRLGRNGFGIGHPGRSMLRGEHRFNVVAAGSRGGANQAVPHLESHVFVDRTGVCLLFGDTIFGQQVNN